MELTIKYLTDKFEVYNMLYFNNLLPIPKFKITSARHTLGQYKYNGLALYSHTICVTDYYNRPTEKDYDQTLIHEMIHYFIKYMKIEDTSSHGRIFKQQCKRINKDGWDLARTTDIRGWAINPKYAARIAKKEEKKANRKRLVFVVEDHRKRQFAFCTNKTSLPFFEQCANRCGWKYKYLFSNNDVFQHWQNCKTRMIGNYLESDERLKQYAIR